MPRTYSQAITLKASPRVLFDTYLNPKRHSAVTGRRVRISRRAGSRFSAFDGIITGRNLVVVPQRLIVQAWRSKDWEKTDLDSIVIFTFTETRGGARIGLTHVNVPDHDYLGVKRGWIKYYWRPWRAYLRRKARQ